MGKLLSASRAFQGGGGNVVEQLQDLAALFKDSGKLDVETLRQRLLALLPLDEEQPN